VTRAIALVLVTMPTDPVSADPRIDYVPEFVCAASMSTPAAPARSCAVAVEAGHWHFDMDTAYLLDGSFGIRVQIPDGRSAEWWCWYEADVVTGRSRSGCGGGFAGIGDEAGSTMGPFDGNAFLHVKVPTSGTFTLTAGEGRGIAMARGARAVP
jgi:hypothetical protein